MAHKTFRLGQYKVSISFGANEGNYMPRKKIVDSIRYALPHVWSNKVQGWTLNIWHFRLRIKQVW